MGPKVLAKEFHFWGESKAELSPGEIIAQYESGAAGAYLEPEEREALIAENCAMFGFADIDSAAHAFGWADSGKGKLVIPFVHVLEAFPGCWPGPAQARGDCVSHSAKNAGLGTMVCEVVEGKADQHTGVVEDYPEVPAQGILEGVFSTESIYWYRGHGGDGWSCAAACRVMQRSSGLWVRKNYPEIGVDLTQYSGSLAGKWGASPPPEPVTAVGRRNLVRAFALAKTPDERRDALANGYFGNTCGGESFSNVRDVNGVSQRTAKGWAHAMASIGWDDRESTVKLYGRPLELILNSWGTWNKGPRDIRDTASLVPSHKKQDWIAKGIVNPETGNILIPHGAFWAKASDTANREWQAMSSVNGWPRRKMLDWGRSLAG
jgi:hypothetical protein